jgi:NADH-quinone oxidoreductase subunit N
MFSIHYLDELATHLLTDLFAFLPELILCATIVLMLVLRLFSRYDRWHLGWVALVFSLLALGVSWAQWSGVRLDLRWIGLGDLTIGFSTAGDLGGRHGMFSGLLAYDNFTIFVRMFLLSFAALIIWLSMLTGIPDREDSGDFYCFVLGATLGMSIMASANHLLMVYIGVEMASLPSYALAGFLKGKRQSSEAALKYVVYGGGASGIMLYGISLLAGRFGTAYLPEVASGYMAALHQAGQTALGLDLLILLGTLFILIGLGFKLAAVPFHFWCPDVFEGASTEVAAFLSVASKGAALALLGRLTLVLVGLSGPHVGAGTWLEVARYLAPALGFFAALTATFGNLAAYLQTNLKRLLAYSTIAHAGYMMMALALLNKDGAGAVFFYLVVYLFMNLGAFAIVAFLRNQIGSEDLSSYRGLIQRAPFMTVLLSIFLLSLLGIPPLAGFAAKFQVFSVLFNSGQAYNAAGQPALGNLMYTLLVIGGINTVISAVYYLKVMKVMILDRPEEEGVRAAAALPVRAGQVFYGTILAAMIFVLFAAWGPLYQASSRQGVDRFRDLPSSQIERQVKS